MIDENMLIYFMSKLVTEAKIQHFILYDATIIFRNYKIFQPIYLKIENNLSSEIKLRKLPQNNIYIVILKIF